eukprot:658250-Rhodomonas_salina.1
MLLTGCYAMCGTDIGYAATRRRDVWGQPRGDAKKSAGGVRHTHAHHDDAGRLATPLSSAQPRRGGRWSGQDGRWGKEVGRAGQEE